VAALNEQDKGRKAFFWRLVGALGLSGVLVAFGIIFAVRDAVKRTDVLSCANRIKYAERQRDDFWTQCLILGNEIWQCRQATKE